jgi:hypothetical protein
VQLPDSQTHAHRRRDDGERDEQANSQTTQRTSTSNVPVSTRRFGLTWTQIR